MSLSEEAAYEEPQDAAPEAPAFVPPAAEDLAAMLTHYQVDHIIAAGGMGAVYRAKQTDLDRSVAIKVLPPEALQDEESLARFRSEARSMAKLTHPNIPAVYDFGVAHGYCYFVMEFVEGLNLHQIIHSGALTPDRAMELLGQVCDAVNFAHSKGIVHGDIKPANIIVDGDGRAKLTDFGLARLVEHEGENWTPMGTPEYAAPELYLRGGRSDYRADLYSIGVLFYEMLKGKPPQGQFPLPSEELGLDGRVDHIIAKCLEQEPEKRFSSALEVAQILDGIRRMPHPPSKRKVVTLAKQPGRRRPVGRRELKRPVPAAAARASGSGPGPPFRARRDNRPLIIGIAVLIVLGIVVMIAMRGGGGKDNKRQSGSAGEGSTGSSPPAAEVAETALPDAAPADQSLEAAASAFPLPADTEAAETAAVPVVSDPAPAAGKPVTAEQKLKELRNQFQARWKTEVEDGLEREQAVLARMYRAELGRLYTAYMDKSDPGAALAVRMEEKRFSKSGGPVPDIELAKVDRLLELQKKFRGRYEAARRTVAPAMEKCREDYLYELDGIQSGFVAADDAAGVSAIEDEIDRAASSPDLKELLK